MELERQSVLFELTLSLLALIIIAATVLFCFVLPEFKEAQGREQQQEAQTAATQRLQKKYDLLYGQRSGIEKTTAALEQRLENVLTLSELQRWIATHLPNVRVAPARRSPGYEVNATVKSPTDLYDFIRQLESAPWLLSVKRPLTLKKASTHIDVSFRVIETRMPEERALSESDPDGEKDTAAHRDRSPASGTAL